MVLDKGFFKVWFFFSGRPLFSNQKKKYEFAEPLFSNLKKCGFFFLSTTFLIKKIQVWRTIFLEPDFSNQVSQTRFLKPLFYTFPEKWLQIKWSTGLSDNVWKIVLNFLLYDVNLANWRHRPLYLTLFKFSSALIWTTKEYLDPLCHWVNTTARISPPPKKKSNNIVNIFMYPLTLIDMSCDRKKNAHL